MNLQIIKAHQESYIKHLDTLLCRSLTPDAERSYMEIKAEHETILKLINAEIARGGNNAS